MKENKLIWKVKKNKSEMKISGPKGCLCCSTRSASHVYEAFPDDTVLEHYSSE